MQFLKQLVYFTPKSHPDHTKLEHALHSLSYVVFGTAIFPIPPHIDVYSFSELLVEIDQSLNHNEIKAVKKLLAVANSVSGGEVNAGFAVSFAIRVHFNLVYLS